MMKIGQLRQRKMLVRLGAIFDAEPGLKEGDELEVPGILIDNYEKEHDRTDTVLLNV